jgi:hypothetical protein
MVALSRTKRKKQSNTSKRTLPLQEMKLGEALSMAAAADSLLKAALESLEEIDEIVTEMRKRFKGSVLFPALEEFLLPHIFRRYWSRGKKVDMWGAFFLLIVTEYMKTVCDRPKYRLADDLLRATRRVFNQAKLKRPPLTHNHDIDSDGRFRVAGRISKLKSEHPNWAAVVNPVIRQLHKQGNKNGKNSAAARMEDCSLNRQSVVFRLFASELSRRGLRIPAEIASKYLSPAVAPPKRKVVTANVK